MGYRALKEDLAKKKKKLKCILLCVLLGLILIFVVICVIFPPENWKYHFSKPDVKEREDGELRIHFIDVGQGDCTLIELPDGKVVLIDGGDSKESTKKQILRYLNALDIDRIDHLVVTHTDKDHCGSLEEVFRCKEVVNAYLPHTYEAEDVAYGKAYAAALEEECAIVKAERGVDLSNEAEGYVLRFLYPYSVESTDEYCEDSAVLWLDYKGVSALFCGDADASVEKKLLRDETMGFLDMEGVDLSSTEILKVAHHGSDASSTKEFLELLRVKTAILSCGKDNPYGHPAKSTMERLEGLGVEIFRTDRQGNVIVTLKEDGSYATETVKSE